MTDKYRDLTTGEQKYGKKIQMNLHTIPTPLSRYCPKNYWKYVLHGNCIDYILTEDYTALKRLLQKFPEFVNDCGYAKMSPLSMGSTRCFGSAKDFINRKNRSQNDYTLLHEAVQMNQLHIAKYLLEIGADVGACSENGNTPLHLAVEDSNVLAVKLLLSYKADPNAVNKSGYDSFKKAPASFGNTFKSIVSNGVSAEEIDVAMDDSPVIVVNALEEFKTV